jgi:hypothetical protein
LLPSKLRTLPEQIRTPPYDSPDGFSVGHEGVKLGGSSAADAPPAGSNRPATSNKSPRRPRTRPQFPAEPPAKPGNRQRSSRTTLPVAPRPSISSSASRALSSGNRAPTIGRT